jgi:hypothetical protein
VVHACNPSYSGGRNQKDHSSKPAGKINCETLSQKYSTQNRAGGVTQVIQCLPNKCEALSSNPSTAKQRKKKEQK